MSKHDTLWKPCGNKILVRMDRVEDVTPGGLIIPRSKGEREEMSQMVGEIVAVGESAWGDQPHVWAKVGDRVKFAKFAGFLHKEEGSDELYRVMHDLDIVMVLRGGNNE